MRALSYTGKGVTLRVGELFLKGKNRFLFEKALEQNLRRCLEGRPDVELVPSHGRLFVLGADDEDLISRLSAVFGVASLSPVLFCEKTLPAISATAVELAKDHPGTKTFRVSSRRGDKTFELTSQELNRDVGAAVFLATGWKVDLESPDLNIGLEIGPYGTFLWSRNLKGAGGLPTGTGGKALLLLSGGIDSPVAGHFIQKRGLELDAVYFHSFPYTSDGAKDKVVRLASVLARRQRAFRLHVVPFTAIQELLRDQVEAKQLVVLYRRAMLRIAERIARQTHAMALVTGESLGQVASQTLHNLCAINDAAHMPVLRPLIGFDKQEVVELAKAIGTFEISTLPHDDCCSLFVPRHPETKAHLGHIRDLEARADLEDAIAAAASIAESLDL
jgi:thiamine biosynthesis protein ThiI